MIPSSTKYYGPSDYGPSNYGGPSDIPPPQPPKQIEQAPSSKLQVSESSAIEKIDREPRRRIKKASPCPRVGTIELRSPARDFTPAPGIQFSRGHHLATCSVDKSIFTNRKRSSTAQLEKKAEEFCKKTCQMRDACSAVSVTHVPRTHADFFCTLYDVRKKPRVYDDENANTYISCKKANSALRAEYCQKK